MQRILHFCHQEKFISDFIEFVGENFDMRQHEFRIFGGDAKYSIPKLVNVKVANENIILKIIDYMFLVVAMCRARKIIVHGLFNPMLICILWAMPWLLKKCYWVMWGGDLYGYQLEERNWKWLLREFFRRSVIKKMGCLVTYIKGDYELAQKWYGAQGEYQECFMYPSNLYKEYALPLKRNDVINIMVGNSADPTNNHAEVFERLISYKDQNIRIYCPLSYGSTEYVERMLQLGKELFGDQFTPLLDFMPFEKYLELLGQIDIVVFAHKRQQAMGNTISLLGLGKKVYMKNDVTPYRLFADIGVTVFNINNININLIDKRSMEMNRKIVKGYFSEKRLVSQYQAIFR